MVTKDFEELFACFNVRHVKAVIVGGYAFSFHASGIDRMALVIDTPRAFR